MKKSLLITIIAMVIISNIAFAQASGNIYTDSKNFLKDIESGNDEFLSIVSYYFEKQATTANVRSLLSSNSFLSEFSTRANTRISGTHTAATPIGFTSSITGMNVSKYADGAAKFLIERGKLEISMSFFSKLNSELKKYPELKVLLPRSFEVIKKIESHNFQNLLQELKDAFSKDLTNMPTSLLNLRYIDNAVCNGNSECITRIATIKAAYSTSNYKAVILSLIAMQGIIDGNNIQTIVNKMVMDDEICKQTDAFSAYTKATAILLEMFRSGESDGSQFLSQADISEIVNSPDLLKVFLGLGFQKFNSKPCYSGLVLEGGKTLEDLFKDILAGQQKFFYLLGSFDKINLASIGIIRKLKTSEPVTFDQSITLISSSLQIISETHKAISVITGISLREDDTKFLKNLSIATEICVDIQNRNFAGIVNGTISFIEGNAIIADAELKDKLVKYLAFAANMSSATTSDEVKEAIDAIALPPGSFSIKQKTSSSIFLNAYIGYAWDFRKGEQYMRGVYAPIGFTFSKGVSRKWGGSVSVFVSLLDIGGIAAYRLHDSSTDELQQEVRLESIFSPSAQLQIGIPKTPLALTAGWRATPKLFYSQGSSDFITVSSKNVFNLSLLIDIPIVTLHSKPF